MSRPPALTVEQVRDAIDWALKAGSVVPSRHCLRDRMPLRNVSMADVKYCPRVGAVSADIEWDEGYADWKYRVEGVDTEYDALVVVIAFLLRANVLVVTVS